MLRRFAPRNDGETCLRVLAACFLREVCVLVRLPRKRGRRECRALDAPAASHAVRNKAYERSHHGYTGTTRHSRTRMVLTASFVLSPEIGLVCLRHLPEIIPRSLTPASRRQAHTTSPSAGKRPRLGRRLRPPHPAPRFVTLRNAPSVGRDSCEYKVIWVF